MGRRSKMKFSLDDRNLKINVGQVHEKTSRRIDILLDYYAVRGEEYMKTNAVWTDRTGAARNGLFTQAVAEDSIKQIIFSHSVEYGIYLETMESGQYQIINPAIRIVGAELMHGLENMLEKI